MSGGFFRGTSADQDTRFSNKNVKLLKTQKFPPELDEPVDLCKVKLDVIKPWIAKRVTEILGGVEDDVLINLIYALLEEKKDGKEIQIQITGFLEKNTSKFMKELWSLLLSAQKNISGVPQQFIDEKAEETRRKKEFDDRINFEVQRLRQVHEQEQAATAEHNRKLTADVEAAKRAAAEAAARLSAQLLEQKGEKKPAIAAITSADAPDVPDQPAEEKQRVEVKQQSPRSSNLSDKSRSPRRNSSRSPYRRGRRSPSPAPLKRARSRTPPQRRRISRSRSPPRRPPSRSYSRSPSRDSPLKASPPRYRRSRSPPRDVERGGGGYFNGRSAPTYGGRRDKERDWQRRPSDRQYDRPVSDRYYDRRSDRRDSYSERMNMKRVGDRGGRRPVYDNRRGAYEDRDRDRDRYPERGYAGMKRPYRDIGERHDIPSPPVPRKSASPVDERASVGAGGLMEQDSEEDVRVAAGRGSHGERRGRGDDLAGKEGPAGKGEINHRKEGEAREDEHRQEYPDRSLEAPEMEDLARKESLATEVDSSEAELEHEKPRRKDSREEVREAKGQGKMVEVGDESPADSEERRELKRKRKEEKRARKEERRKKREEKRKRKEEKRAAKEAKESQKVDVQSRSDEHDENGRYSDDGEEKMPVERQRRLEEDLRKKALESLRAKKIGAA